MDKNNPWLSLIMDMPLRLVLVYRIGEKNGQAKNGYNGLSRASLEDHFYSN